MRPLKFSYIFQHDETGVFMDQRFTMEQIEGAAKGFLAQCSAEFPRFSIVARREFTGVLDKNGKEIYGGDILQLGNKGSVLYTVCWCADAAKFWAAWGAVYLDSQFWTNAEIIGNIYENADLIK